MSESLSLTGELFLRLRGRLKILDLLEKYSLDDVEGCGLQQASGELCLNIDVSEKGWDVVESFRELVVDAEFSELVTQRGWITVVDNNTGDPYWQMFCIPYGRDQMERDIAETERAIEVAQMQLSKNKVLKTVLQAARAMIPVLAEAVSE